MFLNLFVLNFRFIVEFQWFLMWLSVLPGRSLLINAHLLPYMRYAWINVISSSSVHLSFLMSGFRWLCHLSLHCFPIRPLKCLAISDQFLGPFIVTNFVSLSSSSSVHMPLTNFGFNTFCHLCRHWTSVRLLKWELIFFQFFAPCFFTSFIRSSSSSLVQYLFLLIFRGGGMFRRSSCITFQ
jgi:hypothetical protein